MPAGPQHLVWDGRNEAGGNVPSGVYLWKLTAGDHTVTKRVVVVH